MTEKDLLISILEELKKISSLLENIESGIGRISKNTF